MNTAILIDDHQMVRRGLAAWLTETGGWQILGQAGSPHEAIALFETLTANALPSVILLDIDLNGSWGLDLIPLLRLFYIDKPPPVLVYSVYDDYAHIKAALRAEARGYVCKSQDSNELREAMEKVAAGEKWFSSSLVSRIAAVSDKLLGLTKRERQVFDLVQRRHNNREIAAALDISIRTVENNLSLIYDKTGAANRKALEYL